MRASRALRSTYVPPCSSSPIFPANTRVRPPTIVKRDQASFRLPRPARRPRCAGRWRSADGRSQQVLASGAAPALDQALAVGVVVISELFSLANLPRRANPDRAIDDVDVAVGAAGVVDEAGVVAADAGIDHGAVRQLEAPDVTLFDVARFALQAHLVRDLLAGVVDDARVLRNRLRRVDAPSLNLRSPLFDHVIKITPCRVRSLRRNSCSRASPSSIAASFSSSTRRWSCCGARSGARSVTCTRASSRSEWPFIICAA